MLSFGNATCAAQISAQPKSSFPFHEKLSTYVSPRVSVSNMENQFSAVSAVLKKLPQKSPIMNYEQLLSSVFSFFHGLKVDLIFF
jgi:hypothetical protein